MSDVLPLNPNELLTTTRAVRKRLNFDKPVPISLVKEAIEIAVQAPSGSNSQNWHWIIVTDQDKKDIIAQFYQQAFYAYANDKKNLDAKQSQSTKYAETMNKVSHSAFYLADNLAKVPILVIVGIEIPQGKLPDGNQASIWGSVLPAAWSFALAARARGLGTAWTTLHLEKEQEIAQLLNIPNSVRQGVLFPVAYTIGTDFTPGPRLDLDPIIHINSW